LPITERAVSAKELKIRVSLSTGTIRSPARGELPALRAVISDRGRPANLKDEAALKQRDLEKERPVSVTQEEIAHWNDCQPMRGVPSPALGFG
jgi:hypothetical protein